MLKARQLHLSLSSLLNFQTQNHVLWKKDAPVFQGGNLSPLWILSTYVQGFYPLYFKEGEEIFWWSPDPRMVLFLDDFHLSSRFKRTLRKNPFTFTFNQVPQQIIESCAKVSRRGQGPGEVWIYSEIIDAYGHMADLGYVHSVEVWKEGRIVGGLYGLALGKIFFGESMFSIQSGASRAGFAYLIEILRSSGFWLVDCQQESKYLASMGAKLISREQFLNWLEYNRKYL